MGLFFVRQIEKDLLCLVIRTFLRVSHVQVHCLGFQHHGNIENTDRGLHGGLVLLDKGIGLKSAFQNSKSGTGFNRLLINSAGNQRSVEIKKPLSVVIFNFCQLADQFRNIRIIRCFADAGVKILQPCFQAIRKNDHLLGCLMAG